MNTSSNDNDHGPTLDVPVAYGSETQSWPVRDTAPTNGVLDGLMRTHGAMTKVADALEAHKLSLLGEVDVVDAHCKNLMDLAQAERQSKLEAVQAQVAMVDRMLADLRGA